MLDKRGVLRGRCQAGGCDCDEYEPEAESNDCSYCGHKPVNHEKGPVSSGSADNTVGGVGYPMPPARSSSPPSLPPSANVNKIHLDSFSHLEELPEVIITVIIEHLDAASLCSLGRVSRAFNRRTKENDLWKHLLVMKYEGFRYGTFKSMPRLASLLVSSAHFDRDTVEYFSTRIEEEESEIVWRDVYRLLHTTGWARRRLRDQYSMARNFFGELQLIEALIDDYDNLKERFVRVGNQSKNSVLGMVRRIDNPHTLAKYYSSVRHSMLVLALSLEKIMKDMLMFLHDMARVEDCLKNFVEFDRSLSQYIHHQLCHDTALCELEKTYLEFSRSESRMSTHKLKKLAGFCAKVKERQEVHCTLHRILRDQIQEMDNMMPKEGECRPEEEKENPFRPRKDSEEILQKEVEELVVLTASITFPLAMVQEDTMDMSSTHQCKFCEESISPNMTSAMPSQVPDMMVE